MRKKIAGWVFKMLQYSFFFCTTDFYAFVKQMKCFPMEASVVFLQCLLACEDEITHIFISL